MSEKSKMLKKFTLKSSIVADVPTRNGNVYPKEVLEEMIADFNQRHEKGAIIPVCSDLVDPVRLSTMLGVTEKLNLTEKNELEAEVSIFDPAIAKLVGMFTPVVHTRVEISEGRWFKMDSGELVVDECKLTAVSLDPMPSTAGTEVHDWERIPPKKVKLGEDL